MEKLCRDKFEEASEIVSKVTLETKLVYSEYFSNLTGNKIYIKPENMQYTGAYKVRGAYYKISTMSEEDRAKGIVTASAGNHAQGVALAASKIGINSLICLPATAPLSKVEATKGYGADVCLVDGVYDDAYKKALELRDEFGYTFVHPFDDEDVIAGQGTIALELLKDLDDIDAVVVPIGGGGLISGIAYAIKTLNPSTKVYGVQAAGAPSMYNSINQGRITTLDTVSTIADGIAVKQPGQNTFDLVNKYVDDIALVTEDEISSAILSLIEKQKMIAEGAGAVSVAAAMFEKLPLAGKKVVSVVSGGNVDVTSLNRIINRGLAKTGRRTTLLIELVDKPGQLKDVAGIIAAHGGNVINVYHEQNGETASVNGCYLRIGMETRNFDHVSEIQEALKAEGFRILETY